MVFACKKCGARYRIDDKVLSDKPVRFACRKCGQVHLLKNPATGEEPVVAAESGLQQQPRTTTAVPRTTTSLVPPIPRQRTVELARAMQSEQSQGPDVIWFALRRGQRIGPFTGLGLSEQLRAGVLHERSFVWRPTMEKWTRMNQVPELAAMLAEYREWAKSSDRTVVTAAPAPQAPLPDSQMPPIQADTSASVRVEQPRRAESTLVDSLYDKVSQPSLDPRRAEQVPDEEPPPLPSSQPGPKQAPARAAPRPQEGPAPMESRRDWASWAQQALEMEPSPVSGSSSVEQAGLDSRRPVMVPAQAWPSHSEDIAWPTDQPDGPVIIPRRGGGAAPQPQPSQNLQEFSLLMRLGKKSRRNALVAVLVVGGGLLLTIGLLIGYTVLTPTPQASATQEALAPPPPPVVVKVEPTQPSNTELPPERDWVKIVASKAKSRPQDTNSMTEAAQPVKPPPPKEQLAPVDPSVKREFDRFGALIAAREEDKQEVMVDVKPRTLTDMPKQTRTKAGMDSFLSSKMRKFAECKQRMTHGNDMPVKVGLSFSIDTDGHVSDVVVEQSGIRDENLDRCIRRIVSGWAFPPAEEVTTFKTTLLL